MKTIIFKLLLSAVSLITCFTSKAQMYYAGQHLSTYNDIIPNTFIDFSCANQFSMESFFFDMNGDSLSDFELNAYCSVSPGMSGYGINISPISPGSYVRFGHLDSAYNTDSTFWMFAKVADQLYYGDSINSPDARWDSTTMVLTYSFYTAGSGILVTDWVSSIDEYIGIKYQNTSDTVYGWIRVNCPSGSGCYIKDYSIGISNPGIQESELLSVNIFPNPVKDKLTIETQQQAHLEILTITGQKIISVDNQSKVTTIDLGNFSNGIYVLKILTDKGISVNKFIKQ